MDVRCERCRAQYVFDDDQVTPSGLTVQCTNCGHVFKVKKKELVVTVPVKADELQGTPMPASAAGARASAPAPSGSSTQTLYPSADQPATTPVPTSVPEWRVRQSNGNVFTFRELTTLQKWIIEQKVSRDDEISRGTDNWKRLGNIPDLAGFFQVVEAAERGKAQAAAPAVTPIPVYPVTISPPGAYPAPGGYPPPSFLIAGTTPTSMPIPQAAPAPPQPAPGGRAAAERGRPRPSGGSGTRTALLGVLLLVVAAGAAVYVFRPEWLGLAAVPAARSTAAVAARATRPPPAAPAPPQAAVQGPPAGAPAAGEAPANAPVPTPKPVGDAALPKPPEPVAKPEAQAKAAQSPKALLGQATRLRERGDAARALELYDRVIALQPRNADALAGRGLCQLDLSRYPAAEESFQAALEIQPEHDDALLGLAEAYRWQGRKADAIKYYEQYLAFHPDGDEAAVARNAISQLKE
jgi:predicted Zn finger-like uncharacterized protein